MVFDHNFWDSLSLSSSFSWLTGSQFLLLKRILVQNAYITLFLNGGQLYYKLFIYMYKLEFDFWASAKVHWVLMGLYIELSARLYRDIGLSSVNAGLRSSPFYFCNCWETSTHLRNAIPRETYHFLVIIFFIKKKIRYKILIFNNLNTILNVIDIII